MIIVFFSVPPQQMYIQQQRCRGKNWKPLSRKSKTNYENDTGFQVQSKLFVLKVHSRMLFFSFFFFLSLFLMASKNKWERVREFFCLFLDAYFFRVIILCMFRIYMKRILPNIRSILMFPFFLHFNYLWLFHVQLSETIFCLSVA